MADLIKKTEETVAQNLDVFIIMLVIFIVIYYLFSLIAAAFTAGYLAFLSGIISGILAGFALGWYVATLFDCVYVINSGKKVDYARSIMNGLHTFIGRKEAAVSVIGLYVISGVIVAGTHSILGALLGGLFIAAASAIALVSLAVTSRQFDFAMLAGVHQETPNAGFFIYITILVAIAQISVIGFLQIIMLPFAVAMIGSSETVQSKPKQPVQPTPAPAQGAAVPGSSVAA